MFCIVLISLFLARVVRTMTGLVITGNLSELQQLMGYCTYSFEWALLTPMLSYSATVYPLKFTANACNVSSGQKFDKHKIAPEMLVSHSLGT